MPSVLVVAADLDKKEVQKWLKEDKPNKAVADFIKTALKNSKARNRAEMRLSGTRLDVPELL
jgi:hypothetical protein